MLLYGKQPELQTPAWDQWAKAAPSELTEKSSNPGLILTRDLLRNKFLRAAIGRASICYPLTLTKTRLSRGNLQLRNQKPKLSLEKQHVLEGMTLTKLQLCN